MRRSFTLVELVLVIVLTMILTAAALAGLSGAATWRASAAVRRVQTDVDYARNLAIMSGRRTLCLFDAGGTSYQVQQEVVVRTGTVLATTLTHPQTGAAWQVSLNDLSSGGTVVLSPAQSPPALGFSTGGLVINASGTVLPGDLTLTFQGGAVMTVYRSSGLTEVRWP